jgi:hypothetical protein
MGAFKFRVLLDTEKESEIFRDLLINENDDFESLYNAIIQSFNFTGEEMASFYISNENWDKGHEISLVDLNYGDESIDEKASIMSQAKIKDFIEAADQKIILVYDFMRMWIFLIELVEKLEDNIGAPEVALAIGMAPPEDSRSTGIEDVEEDHLFDDEEFDEDEDDLGLDDYEDGYFYCPECGWYTYL